MFFINKILVLKILLLISISASMHAAQINMRDADIRIFSADIAKLTNKTIILDPRIKGNVTVISDQDLDPDEAYAVFLSVLRLHGFSAIQTGDVIKVMPESGARQDASSNRISQDSLVTEVVKLSGADAKALVPLLKPLVNKQGHIAAYEATNTLILADYEGNIFRLKKILTELDKNSGSKKINLKVIYLKYAQASDVRLILEKMATSLENAKASSSSSSLQTTSIQSHEDTNSLIISAKQEIFTELESVINRLDIRRAQVLVEAIIVELSDSLAKDLGVQFLFRGNGNNTPVAAQKFGSPNPDLISAVTSQSSIDGSSGSSSLGTAAANSLLGIEGLAVGIGKINSGGNTFASIINLVAEDSDSNILSTPSIMTLDNEEASIVVGQEIPVTTGETLSSNNSNPFRSVNREEVGIKLVVKPQINEGSAVILTLNQEVSSVFGPITAMSTDLITNKRVIKTTVLVEDGDTIVLGGLIDDNVQEVESRVPVIGNIPLLGRLFRSTSTSRNKRNLIVFIKPTIIRDPEQMRVIGNSKYDFYRDLQKEKINKGEEVPNLEILKENVLKN
jgi:general secretion pathway protein D